MSQQSLWSLQRKDWLLNSVPAAILITLIVLSGSQAQATVDTENQEPFLKAHLPAEKLIQKPVSADKGELRLGSSDEQKIRGGETHSYRITLKAGQYIKVVVEQKGID